MKAQKGRKRGSASKAKEPGYAQRIRDLRESLGLDQKAFAQQIGIKSQAAVSLWEKGRRVPSPEMYIRLAGAAKNPEDILYFWAQAGLKSHTIVEGARRQWSDKFRVPKNWEVVEIGPLPESLDAGTFTLPRWMVKNPESAYYYVAEESNTLLALAPGVVVIDIKDRGSRVAPFLRRIALLRIRKENLIFGRLQTTEDLDLEKHARNFSLFLFLTDASTQGRHPAALGSWRSEVLSREDWREYLDGLSADEYYSLRDEENALGRRQIETDSDIEIIGEATCWFPLPGPGGGSRR